MPSIQSLREEHKKAVDEADVLLKADGELTPENVEKVEALTARAEKLTAEIALCERQLKQAELAAKPSPPAPKPAPAAKPAGYHTSELQLTGQESKYFDNETDALLAGRWVSGFLLENRKAKEWCLAHPDYYEDEHFRLAQSEGDNVKGGLFVPRQLESTLQRLVLQYGTMRNQVRTINIGSDSALVPRPLFGTTWYAVGEVPGADITESDASADSFEITVKNWAGFARLSEDLEEDATISVADALVEQFAFKKTYLEDNVMLNGDGTSTYNGIWGVFNKLQSTTAPNDYSAMQVTAISGNDLFSNLDVDDFTNVIAKMPAIPGARPKFYMSRQGFYSSWARLISAAGGNTKDDLAGGTAQQINGYPVVFTDLMPKTLTGTTGTFALMFGDLSLACTMGVRRGMRMKRLNELYALRRQIGIVVSDRWGFVAHDLTSLDGAGSTAVGPVVVLKFA